MHLWTTCRRKLRPLRSNPRLSSTCTLKSHQGSSKKSHSNNSTSWSSAESNQLTASSLWLLMRTPHHPLTLRAPTCCSTPLPSHQPCAWILHQQHKRGQSRLDTVSCFKNVIKHGVLWLRRCMCEGLRGGERAGAAGSTGLLIIQIFPDRN